MHLDAPDAPDPYHVSIPANKDLYVPKILYWLTEKNSSPKLGPFNFFAK